MKTVYFICGLMLLGCEGKQDETGPAGPADTAEPISTLPGGATMEFVWIEPGTFKMGVSLGDSGDVDARPQHEVTISQGFYLGKCEITQGQWEAVMGTKPWQGADFAQDNPSHPAVYISWDDVQTFIQRLNKAVGVDIYRLPTEAEWEYACRAGTTRRWSFGDDESRLEDYAWYRPNAWDVGLQWCQPAGTKLPNPWGLHDMHGNVWEWVQDWYGEDYYIQSPAVDPKGPPSGSGRVIRGGFFVNFAQSLRSADRFWYVPSFCFNGIGARLLKTQ